MIFFSLIFSLLMILFIVLGIAFITLYERHLLSLSQNRLGPNKVFFLGVVQAALDGVKLMSKEQILPIFSSDLYFIFIPGMAFIFMFLEWLSLPYFFSFMNFQFSYLFLLSLVGVSVYFVIISGLMSNSKFAFLGAVRASSQSVSFEVAFSIYLFCFMKTNMSLSLNSSMLMIILLLVLPFLIMVLAELNRAPFDFSEGESELVSGFNVEHSSVSFIFLFLGEYGVLIFFSVLNSCLFFNFYLVMIFVYFSLLLLIRSAYPRYRYDKLMSFFWKMLLPIVIFIFFFFFYIY